MSRDPRLFLDDMLQSCRKIQRYTRGLERAEFFDDEKTRDAVAWNLEIVGEAAKRVPLELRRRLPEIEWRMIARFRDVLAHAYFSIDEDVLWDVVSRKVPDLEKELESAF